MMKIVFIFVLSLALCLGKPADDQAQGTPPAAPVAAWTSTPKVEIAVPQVAPANATIVPVHPNATEPATATSVTTTDGTPNKTVPKKGEKVSKAEKSKDEKEKMPVKDDKATSTVKPPVTGKAALSTTVKPEVTTKPVTTVAPHTAADDDDKHSLKARGFDGASFIGGIILTLGMLAIGFMGFKYYKNHTESNYHTL